MVEAPLNTMIGAAVGAVAGAVTGAIGRAGEAEGIGDHFLNAIEGGIAGAVGGGAAGLVQTVPFADIPGSMAGMYCQAVAENSIANGFNTDWEEIKPTEDQKNVAIVQGAVVGGVSSLVPSDQVDAMMMGVSCGVGDGVVKLSDWIGQKLGGAGTPPRVP